MTNKDLPHDQEHEWYGTFWFPTDEELTKYSGKVSYSPTTGIKLSLQEVELSEDTLRRAFDHRLTARKAMNANVHNESGPKLMTLFNVIIQPSHRGSSGINFAGSAAGLIMDVHCVEGDLGQVSFKYDEHYENFFLFPNQSEENMISFDRGRSLTLKDGFEVSMQAASSGTGVHSTKELDSIFWSIGETDMEEVKEALKPILDKEGCGLLRRNNTEFRTAHTCSDKNFDDFLKHERVWRSFFELLVSHPVSVEKAWGLYEVEYPDEKTFKSASPMLISICVPKKVRRRPDIVQNLPINFYKIGDEQRNLTDMAEGIQRWYDINTNEDWSPVIDCINRLMKIDETFGDTSQFSILVSDIETLFDLFNGKKGDADDLINGNASEDWKTLVSKELPLPSRTTIGQHLSDLRNAIVHPSSCGKKRNGLYSQLRKDPYKLQAAYAYLGALYLKAILNYLDVADDKAREAFGKRFIDLHAHYSPIDFI